MRQDVFRFASGRSPEDWERPALMGNSGAGTLDEWWEKNREEFGENLSRSKMVLIRKAPIRGAEDFSEMVERICPCGKLPYVERSTTRKKISDRIYNSTEYPSHKKIELHSENTFQLQWPRLIFFYANKVAFTRGQTPVAFTRSIYANLPGEIAEEFANRQILYVRNFGGGLEINWRYAFQTESREEVEKYCLERGILFEWKSNDRLCTKQVLPAVIRCPETGSYLWLNQAHLFHITNLEPKIRAPLLKALGAENLPRHVLFGDGAPIPDEYFDAVRTSIIDSSVEFDWEQDDLLVLDNRYVSHGRNPFEGERQILVAMGELDSYSNYEVKHAMEA